MEIIKFLWKDALSNVGNCPSLSTGRDDEGRDGYIVVGKKVSPEFQAQVPEVGDGEGVLFVPANVIDRVRDLG